MKVKKNKKTNIIKIVSIFTFIIAIMGISYAFFIHQVGSKEEIVTSAVLDLKFSETSTLRLKNSVPIRDADVENDASEINFTIQNTGNVDMKTTISLDSVVMSDVLKTEDFNWALYENDTKVKTGNFSTGASTYTLSNDLLIKAGITKRYTVRIWIRDTGLDQSSLTGSTFSAKVTATGYSVNN